MAGQPPDDEDSSDIVPRERRDAIAAALPELKKHLRRKPQLPTDYVAEILDSLLGQYALRNVVDHLTPHDEEDEFDPEAAGPTAHGTTAGADF